MAFGGITQALGAGVKRAAGALGFTPVTLSTALSSPWQSPDYLEQIVLRDLFQLGDRLLVNEALAMELDVVSKATTVLTSTLGRLPLIDTKDGKRNPGNYAGGVRPFLSQPDPAVPRATTLTQTIRQLVFYPAAFWVVLTRDSFGWPRTGRLVPREELELGDDGNLAKAWGKPAAAYAGVIRFDSPTGGLLSHGTTAIRRATVIARAAAVAEDNPVPSFELHNEGADLTNEEIDVVLSRWMEGRKKYGVGYTSKGIKTTAHGQRLEQLLIEGQKRADLMLARKLAVPAWVVDVAVEGSSMAYDNRVARNWELIDLAAGGYRTAIDGRLSMGDVTPAGWLVEFDTDRLTKPDQKTRFETWEVGIRSGLVTVAEARQAEGLA